MIGKHKRPADFNARAASVVADATAEKAPDPEKDPVAVARGRLGGRTPAFRLTARRRREIAQEAVKVRWNSAEDKQG